MSIRPHLALVATLALGSTACLVGLTGIRRDANKNDVAALRARLDRGEDPNEPNGEGETPLHWAVESNALDALRVLVASPKIKIDAVTNFGRMTPLDAATMGGRLEAMKILLDAGADPNGVEPRQDTPLCFAATWRKAEAAALLLSRGAELRRSCKDGKLAIDLAKEPNYVDSSDPGPVIAVLEAAAKAK